MTEDSNNPTPQRRPLALDDILLPNAFAYEEGTVDFAVLFGNSRPVELEIGSGKGTFLVHRAKARPEVNFLGIEWANQYCRLAADRMARWGLGNVRMLRADAAAFVQKRIADNSLQRVHIYFPDPWPKTRHRKRRIIQPPFVELIYRKLCIGGQLAVVTDHRDYARQMAWVIFGQRGFATVPFPRTHGAGAGEVVGTNFERKYIAQGRRFFSLAVMKWR
ncbi:MAG: tRNA (guanosine(46)-N7)-methyltransferase TrmB [Planctomycetes bacterium]|nr:tRNA (guanosine(46)-N7)-methyltransferase TrmB [Planctomycetota bacterium]